jgi:hypothetical protein
MDEAEVTEVQDPQTTASLVSDKPTQARPQAPPRVERDRKSELCAIEQYVDRAPEFYKMIHLVADGGARPNAGAARWRAIIRQGKAFTMLWRHITRATNNSMELRAVTEALKFLAHGMIIHLRGQAPDGCLDAPDTARMRGKAWGPIEPSRPLRSFTPRVDGLSVVTPLRIITLIIIMHLLGLAPAKYLAAPDNGPKGRLTG